ncbi:MAG: cbb3-type cytochrome c oxidase N-terminal domain-containing protein [Roseivirga sp.]
MKQLILKLKPFRKLIMTLSLMFAGGGLMAQSTTESTTFWTQEVIFYALLALVFITAVLVLVVAVYVLQMLKTFVLKDMSEEQRVAYESEPSWFDKLWNKWNDLKPLEEEEALILDHDYDGIKELDNHLPPWWKGLFYLTIVYGVIYIMVFHVFKTAPLQAEQYKLEMAAAEEMKNNIPQPEVDFDENTVTFTDDTGDLIAGKEIFERQCGTCHKNDGGGLAGPNLTDQYWKHGGGIQNIYKTVKNGIPNTAMISWETLLNPVKMRQVSSYVMTLEGTNPPGAKAAEGDLWVPAESDTTAVNQ